MIILYDCSVFKYFLKQRISESYVYSFIPRSLGDADEALDPFLENNKFYILNSSEKIDEIKTFKQKWSTGRMLTHINQ